jgi:hypothetical protein
MSSLPPPPPAGSVGPAHAASTRDADQPPRPVRAGELTPAWRTTVVVTWVGIVLVWASVWRSSRTMGLSTWWLGPPAEPRLIVVQLLPFVAPVAMVVAASRPTRHLPALGLVASAIGAVIAAGDLGRFTRLGLVELAAALAGALVSVASFAGLLRAAPAATTS